MDASARQELEEKTLKVFEDFLGKL